MSLVESSYDHLTGLLAWVGVCAVQVGWLSVGIESLSMPYRWLMGSGCEGIPISQRVEVVIMLPHMHSSRKARREVVYLLAEWISCFLYGLLAWFGCLLIYTELGAFITKWMDVSHTLHPRFMDTDERTESLYKGAPQTPYTSIHLRNAPITDGLWLCFVLKES